MSYSVHRWPSEILKAFAQGERENIERGEGRGAVKEIDVKFFPS